MEPQPSSKRGIVVLVVVLGVSALLGGLSAPSVRATAVGTKDTEVQDSVKSFTRVLSVVERNYADPVDTDKVIYDGAIPGMLHVLDPHSNFFDPKAYSLLKEDQRGKYYGVGMQVGPRNVNNRTVVIVIAPFVGTPAYRAGIHPGDIIAAVDGKATDHMSTSDVADVLKGPKS